MKTLLSTFGVVPLLLFVWASAWMFTENFSLAWDMKTLLSGSALLGSSLAFILKVHLSDSRFEQLALTRIPLFFHSGILLIFYNENIKINFGGCVFGCNSFLYVYFAAKLSLQLECKTYCSNATALITVSCGIFDRKK